MKFVWQVGEHVHSMGTNFDTKSLEAKNCHSCFFYKNGILFLRMLHFWLPAVCGGAAIGINIAVVVYPHMFLVNTCFLLC